MKKDISVLYENLQPKIKNIEEFRLEKLIFIIILYFIEITAIIGSFFAIKTYHYLTVFIVIGLCILIYISNRIVKVISDSYNRYLKEEIFLAMFSNYGHFNTLEDKNGNRAYLDNYINKLQLFKVKKATKIDDRIQGMYNDLSIDIAEISNVSAICVTSFINNKNKGGIFITIPSFKKYEGSTVITCYKNLKYQMEKVDTESKEFNAKFSVYSSEVSEAKFLLTPELMDKLNEYSRNIFVNNLTVSFEAENVNIFFEKDEDWFEIPIWKSMKNIKNLKKIALQINTIIKMLGILTSEQRIS